MIKFRQFPFFFLVIFIAIELRIRCFYVFCFNSLLLIKKIKKDCLYLIKNVNCGSVNENIQMARKVFLILVWVSIASGLLAQERCVISSRYLGQDDSLLVFKPASYSPSKSYPLVYLLHGHSANYQSWSKLVDLSEFANRYNFIIVCPDGLKSSWYMDSPSAAGWQYESFFLKELMPFVASKYHVDKTNIFITGASMGGYGAMRIFLRHPSLFKSAGSTSGVLNLRYSGFRKSTLASLLGEYSDENKLFDSYSVINLLSNIQNTDKQLIFDSGTEDYLYVTSRKFREKCDELKIKATYIARPGKHTGGYWTKSIPLHFEFFKSLVDL